MPVYITLDRSDKANCRPVSVLPLLSKSFEKINHDQLYQNMEKHIPLSMPSSGYFRNGRQSLPREVMVVQL